MLNSFGLKNLSILKKFLFINLLFLLLLVLLQFFILKLFNQI